MYVCMRLNYYTLRTPTGRQSIWLMPPPPQAKLPGPNAKFMSCKSIRVYDVGSILITSTWGILLHIPIEACPAPWPYLSCMSDDNWCWRMLPDDDDDVWRCLSRTNEMLADWGWGWSRGRGCTAFVPVMKTWNHKLHWQAHWQHWQRTTTIRQRQGCRDAGESAALMMKAGANAGRDDKRRGSFWGLCCYCTRCCCCSCSCSCSCSSSCSCCRWCSWLRR